MSNTTKCSNINYYDQELEQDIGEAMMQFAQCNIRFRSPNRYVGPSYQHKSFKPEREV